MNRAPLPRAFYLRDTHEVAKDLLGKELVHLTPEGPSGGLIVEAEAYLGPDDPAAHSYRGRRSGRTAIQYGPGGMAYVFLIYGMYPCFNVVTREKGRPEVVLVRALQPSLGLDLMRVRRGVMPEHKLANGPGKLCRALGITLADYGRDLTDSPLFIRPAETPLEAPIEASKRVHIDYAGPAADYLWRYAFVGHPCVSKA